MRAKTRLREARIQKKEADARAAEFALLRDQVLLIVFLLMVILTLVLALVDPTMLEAPGTDGALGALLGYAGSRCRRS